MKTSRLLQCNRAGWYLGSLTLLCVSAVAFSAETNAAPDKAAAPEKAADSEKVETPEKAAKTELTPEQMFEGGTNTYNNWIELSAGGFFTSGNKGQFRQQLQKSGDAFGGIEDLHYQATSTNGVTAIVDGRLLFDENDYKVRLDVSKEKLGFVRVNYTEFRTWYNGDGGYYAPTQTYFQSSGSDQAIDRQEISFEAGLRLEKYPNVTFKYTHATREGDKDSTSWGPSHPTFDSLVRGITPSFWDIDETRDIFQLDATHHIKATDFGVGFTYEFSKLNDARKVDLFKGEPVEQKVTDRQGTDYDLFNVHAFSETWVRTNLLFSAGFSYTHLDNDFSGSRIYGTDFDPGYVPSAQAGSGYYGLNGGSRLHEYVMDVNLFYSLAKDLTLVPSIRVLKENTDADSQATETLGTAAPVPFSSQSDYDLLDVRERLDLTYKGFTNWVLYARGEFTQGEGNLNERGGLPPINNIGGPTILRETDDSRFFQKYSAGARWYPLRKLTLDVGGYYKDNHYDYDHDTDNTPNDSANRYPAYLVMHDFETYDGNARLTFRPVPNVTLVSRYEYQWSTIYTRPAGVSGLGEVETAKMPSHILAQDVSWSPWSRLYLQAGFNYVLSETDTPASEVTKAILDAENNYWTLNFSCGIVLDDRTDLNLSYFYYSANNYTDNSEFGLPLGAEGHEHAVTAAITRRLTKNIRLTCKYGYYNYADGTYGGNRDFESHGIYSSLQYRF